MKLMTFILPLFLISCGVQNPQKSSAVKQDVSSFYKASEIRVKVFYEIGAEPYISDSHYVKYWTILEQNLTALFTGRPTEPQITVPKTLNEMTSMPASGHLKWTTSEVIQLSQKMHPQPDESFKIFFLNGRASDGDGIIGFHINGTKIIAIFKDVIRSTGNNEPMQSVPKYVEQATLVHEMGHALGLVNNGVPMQENHHDSAHGAHCTNRKCVMYWANEGASSLAQFAREVALTGSIVMFGDKCLKDTRSY
jgi:hypothetical protein